MSATTRTWLRGVVCWLVLFGPGLPDVPAGTPGPRTCGRCGRTCARNQWVTCTIMVPQTVVETVLKPCVVYVPEEREEEYTVFVRVPETRQFTKTHWYLADEIKSQEITQERCVVVMNPVESKSACQFLEPQLVWETTKRTIDYCIKVPRSREVECGEETVYRLEPHTRTRQVTVQVPQLEKRPVQVEVSKMVPQTISCCAVCARRFPRR